MLEESPELRYLEQNSAFELDATNYDFLPTPAGVGSIQTRAPGGNYTASVASPNSRQTGNLYLHGDCVDVDRTYKADAERGLRDIPMWLTKELRSRIKKFAVDYARLLWQGTGNAGEFKGLRTILNGTNLPGYSVNCLDNAANWIAGSAKSLDLSVEANIDPFIEGLQLALALVNNPTGILMSPAMFARMSTIARKKQMYGEMTDNFGKQISTFDGVPMIKALATTITNDEPDDTATPLTVTTSLYVASPGEQKLSVLTNSGFEWIDYDHQENDWKNREKMGDSIGMEGRRNICNSQNSQHQIEIIPRECGQRFSTFFYVARSYFATQKKTKSWVIAE